MILLRLAIPAVAGWATAFLLVAAPDLRMGTAIGLWLLAILLAVVVVLVAPGGPLLRHWWMIICLLVLVAALTATSVVAHGHARRPPAVQEAAEAGGAVTLTVRIDGPPDAGTGGSLSGELVTRERTRATLLALAPVRPAESPPPVESMAVPVLLFSSAGLLGPQARGDTARSGRGKETAAPTAAPPIGTVLRIRGTVRGTAPEDDVSLLVFVGGRADVVEGPPWWLDWASRLRADFSSTSELLPGDGGDLLPGLVVGDTAAMDERLDSALKQSSLTHLTAVSGANCAIVIGAVLAVTSALGCRRAVRIATGLVALAGFVVLVTPEPSVLRAAVMASIALAAVASGRPLRGVPSLALAVIVLLAIDPWLARSYGFALSALATAGLLVLSGPLTRSLGRVLPVPVAAIVALPVAAQAACQPVLILLAPTLPLYGVPANILAAPAVPVATIAGMVAITLLPVAPPVAMAVTSVAWAPAAWISAVAVTISRLPEARIPWLGGIAGALLLAAVTVLVLVALLGDGNPGRRRVRRLCAACAVVVTGAYLGTLMGSSLRDRLSVPPDWQYAACDVGQGDALLVRSGSAVALVDVGPDPAPLDTCLRRLGIDHIDLLVLTHYDLDHVGGAAAVLGRVSSALVGPTENREDERLLDRLRSDGADVTVATAGLTGRLGALDWSVLWPRDRGQRTLTGNDGSVTMRFESTPRCSAGCVSALLLGDLGEESQDTVLRTAAPGPVDVVKVAHHGSADQSSRLYERVRATAGIISVGADNTYGHPTDSVLSILESTGTTALRTDRGGLTVLAPGPDPGTIRVWSERPDPHGP
ncbi:ComEC/Rec2 family competence protein [Microbacteriaceae bacterium 4G12]